MLAGIVCLVAEGSQPIDIYTRMKALDKEEIQ